MKKCSKCGLEYKNPVNFFQKNKASKDGLRPDCKICCNKKEKLYRDANKEKVSNTKKRCYENKKEYYLQKTKQYANENKAHLSKKRKEYEQANKEVYQAHKKVYYNKNRQAVIDRAALWNKENPSKRNAIHASRRAGKLQATPTWSEKSKIKKVYKKARWLGNLTGLKYHVDHIIPLNGDGVCGLHVWANLQILEDIINIKKGTKY